MTTEQATKTIQRLQVYAELLKQRLTSEPNQAKREFLERDLKKTLAKVTTTKG